ncbi:MAG: hypothetical protein V8T31_08105 [Lachnospiraceae bacterium]
MSNLNSLCCNYTPYLEVAKLDAYLKTKGNYVVFCVTDDTAKANEIIKEAGF